MIPSLVDHQEDMYKEILQYNNGNVELALASIRSFYNVILASFFYRNDGTVNVPFRISKSKYEDFLIIHDEKLRFYDTDFTNYIRNLLIEYCTNKFAHREALYAYRMLRPFGNIGAQCPLCKVYYKNGCETLFWVSVEESPVCEYNYVVGLTKEFKPVTVRLCEVRKIVQLDEQIKVTAEQCDLISEYLSEKYDEEVRDVWGEDAGEI